MMFVACRRIRELIRKPLVPRATRDQMQQCGIVMDYDDYDQLV